MIGTSDEQVGCAITGLLPVRNPAAGGAVCECVPPPSGFYGAPGVANGVANDIRAVWRDMSLSAFDNVILLRTGGDVRSATACYADDFTEWSSLTANECVYFIGHGVSMRG